MFVQVTSFRWSMATVGISLSVIARRAKPDVAIL